MARRRERLSLAAAMGAALLAFAGAAHAQRPTSTTTEYSPYEKDAIERVLAREGLALDPAPEGKIMRRIDTVRLEVLEARDPIPERVLGVPTRSILNGLHATSRDFVIRREVLLREGDRYLQVMIDETARNMRQRMPLQVSVVLLVPIRTDEAGTVDLLVITKDIWSLRLSYDASITPGGVEKFSLVPQETNLFGRHHTLNGSFLYQPESLSFGAGYKIPRFGTSWIGASAAGLVTINRRRSEPEGASVALKVGQPLASTRAEWAWSVEGEHTTGVARRYRNAEVFPFNARSTAGRDDRIPYEYKTRQATAQAALTRSFGWGLKNNVTLSMNASSTAYETFDLTAFAPEAVAEFRQRALPRGETRIYPALTWQSFRASYMRTLDINTLALQEDYRLGHELAASVYPVLRALGSSRTFLGMSGKAGYALAMGDGLVGASVTSFAENQDGVITDGSVGGSFGIVTPRIGFGRLVMNTSFLNRYRNYLNARTYAGGEDRLRGYPTQYFFGKDTIFYNIEFRSRAIEVLTTQLGAVLFFDAGDAAQSFHALRAKQSVGFGLRWLIPQLNRQVIRADFAFPLKRGPFPETGSDARVDPFGFFITFDQAFTP